MKAIEIKWATDCVLADKESMIRSLFVAATRNVTDTPNAILENVAKISRLRL